MERRRQRRPSRLYNLSPHKRQAVACASITGYCFKVATLKAAQGKEHKCGKEESFTCGAWLLTKSSITK
eukprot:2148059-Pyramimonas_sp.AAC.1